MLEIVYQIRSLLAPNPGRGLKAEAQQGRAGRVYGTGAKSGIGQVGPGGAGHLSNLECGGPESERS